MLRQQALTMSPTGKALSARPKTTIIQVLLVMVIVYILALCGELHFLGAFTEISGKWEYLEWRKQTHTCKNHLWFSLCMD